MTTAELARILRAGERYLYDDGPWPAHKPVTMLKMARALNAMAGEAAKITDEKGE